MMKTEDTNKLLQKKFIFLLYHLKALIETKKREALDAIIGGAEFKNTISILQTVCEEACRKESLKVTLHSVITSLDSGIRAKEHADLHKFIRSSEFVKSVRALERVYKEIYGEADEYENGYKHFFKEINDLTGAGIPMWLKLFVGVAGTGILVGGIKAYRVVKKRKKETAEK